MKPVLLVDNEVVAEGESYLGQAVKPCRKTLLCPGGYSGHPDLKGIDLIMPVQSFI